MAHVVKKEKSAFVLLVSLVVVVLRVSWVMCWQSSLELVPLTKLDFTRELWWCWWLVPRWWGGPPGWLCPCHQWTSCSYLASLLNLVLKHCSQLVPYTIK